MSKPRPLDENALAGVFRGAGDIAIGGLVPRDLESYVVVRNPPNDESTGSIHSEVAAAMVAAIQEAGLAPPSRFGVWRGYAEFSDLLSPVIELAPGRSMIIFEASREYAQRAWTEFGSDRIPMRWWPEDGSWAVAGDVYSTAVVVGGPRPLADRLLQKPALDANLLTPTSTLRAHDL